MTEAITTTFNIDHRFKSSAYDTRARFLVIHDTEDCFKAAIYNLMGENPDHRVSAHYLVSDDINEDSPSWIYQLVDESKRAWHAGLSIWRSETQLNSASIGIEIVNTNANKNAYKEEQIQAVIELAQSITRRYVIHPTDVVAHGDIAPTRREDPGIMFPWKRLYDAGIGAWPDANDVKDYMTSELPDVHEYQGALKSYGYGVEPTGVLDELTVKVIEAFQRHFRPAKVDGHMDIESWAILLALLKKYFGEPDLRGTP